MRRSVVLLIPAAVLAAGCGGSSTVVDAPPTSTATSTATSTPTGTPSSTPTGSTAAADIRGSVVVSAAASLKESFTTLASRFEKAHAGVTVTLNFGGSDTLAAQITGGAPVDVFAAASTKTMATVTDAKDGLAAPVAFARNELEIATPPGNPKGIASLADTTKSGTKLVICAAAVPCGAAATKAYAAAGLSPEPVSLEQDVKSVLTKVELKEADAGIVYQTDVKAAGAKVTGVPFPEAAQAIASYPIVGVTTGKNPAAGAAFITYVLSADGASVLQGAGFLKP